ncbi:MAG: aldo/keto reductase [Bryobacterales bacterium]|nr:aldo/keto reductase [Bryobacterales bacterium]
MRTVKLGTSDVVVSAAAFGTDLIGSRISPADSFLLLDQFAEAGGTFIDTGNIYACWLPGCSGGESESTIGAWMKDRANRGNMVVATKLGFDYPGCEGRLTAAEIERECEKSLKRLQTDRIDVYYAHRDDPATPLEETMGAFAALVKAGKVRAIAASNLPIWRIAEANMLCQERAWPQYVAVEQRHTYFRPRHGASFGPQLAINDDVREYCRTRNLTLIAYSILAQGAYTRQDRPVPAQYAGPDSDERMEALKAVAAETGATLNQVIIAWMRQGNPPMIPILAGSRPEQLRENLAGLDLVLTEEQVERLTTAGNPDVEKAWLR